MRVPISQRRSPALHEIIIRKQGAGGNAKSIIPLSNDLYKLFGAAVLLEAGDENRAVTFATNRVYIGQPGSPYGLFTCR